MRTATRWCDAFVPAAGDEGKAAPLWTYHSDMRKEGPLWLVVGALLVGCGDGSSDPDGGDDPPTGPEQAYDDTTVRCSLWGPPDALCEGSEYNLTFVCDKQPGEMCVESAEPTPSKGQEPWCCKSRCHRANADQDEWCQDGRDAWTCYGTEDELTEFATAQSCELSSQSNLICC